MVLTTFMAAGKVLPSMRKKVVSPTYDLLSRKNARKSKTFPHFMPFKLLNLGWTLLCMVSNEADFQALSSGINNSYTQTYDFLHTNVDMYLTIKQDQKAQSTKCKCVLRLNMHAKVMPYSEFLSCFPTPIHAPK